MYNKKTKNTNYILFEKLANQCILTIVKIMVKKFKNRNNSVKSWTKHLTIQMHPTLLISYMLMNKK